MFDITTGLHRHCDRISRRDCLRMGALTALGLGLGDLLRMESALAATADAPKADAVILLWLGGGMSQIDTFDPKPDAPPEIRGHFGTIPTKLAGVRFSDRLPRLAGAADQFSVIRSVTHGDRNHGSADHLMLTGYLQTPTVEYPSYGAVVARELGYRKSLPPFVALPNPPIGSGYLGAQYNAFTVGGDPGAPGFTVRDVQPPLEVNAARLKRRESFLNLVDGAVKAFEHADGPRSMSQFTQRAYAMVTSPAAREAFALDQEPERVRRAYGRTTFGQSALLARRLVERGVRFVTVTKGGWDHHANIFTQLDEGMLADLDQTLSALLIDLKERGMLERTLVLCMGEFGRTPSVNYAVGRDHWPDVASVLVAGGGVRGGQILGASDAKSAYPVDRPVTPGDLAATVYHCLGIDGDKEYHTRDGRPIKILAQGEVVRELLG
jgi:uncharacterized protein (DUF1501 family)